MRVFARPTESPGLKGLWRLLSIRWLKHMLRPIWSFHGQGPQRLRRLTALGKPSLLVPYPHSAGRHQEFNAIKLREMGAAFVVFDNEMSGEVLAKHIREMFGSDSIRKEMQRASRGLGRPDACVQDR